MATYSKKEIKEVIESKDIYLKILKRWSKHTGKIGFSSYDDSFRSGYEFFKEELIKELK